MQSQTQTQGTQLRYVLVTRDCYHHFAARPGRRLDATLCGYPLEVHGGFITSALYTADGDLLPQFVSAPPAGMPLCRLCARIRAKQGRARR
jgi:hypothetical protein